MQHKSAQAPGKATRSRIGPVRTLHGRASHGAAGLLLVACAACTRGAATQPPSAGAPPPSQATGEGTLAPTAASPTKHDAASGDAGTPIAAPSTTPISESCGPFPCLRFPTASAALQHVLDTDTPLALGIGESHAQAHSEHVASATSRFTHELLPAIADRSSALVVELLAPPANCGAETTQRVEAEEREITEGQASTNQNQFVLLGHESKRLGVTPYILRATCEDLDAVAAAGEAGVLVIMETIARLTATEVERLLKLRSPTETRRTVLAYGGALHNDIEPRAGRESWSYGPRLRDVTGGSYTAVDLIVPEHVQDTDSWRSQPWYEYVPEPSADSAVLLQIAPRSWVVFLPAAVPAQSGSASEQPSEEL